VINPELHKKPVALDRVQHRELKLRTELDNLAAAAGLNAFFITAGEFGDVCKEYPILFLRAGVDDQGRAQVAPMAVFGLGQGENLFHDPSNAQRTWRARYVPAMLRAYPFAMAPVDKQQWAVAIDEAWGGWSQTEGQALFDAQGEPTPYLVELRGFIERIEQDVERTRQIGIRLMALNLLEEKRFDATLPDGSPLKVDGFLGLNEKRLNALTDAEVLELHRTGIMGLMHAHQISLTNMAWLVERKLAQQAGGTPAASATH
jgi:SapC